ncbi:MAG: sigma-54 dependent transcriptional regulator [Verrucomicrobiota bacterium]
MSKPRNQFFNCLILEDDLCCAQLIAKVVELDGGKTVICESIQSARETIDDQEFDLLVLDHSLPDGLGSNFFYETRERGMVVPTIMLTGHPDIPTAVELTRSGLFDYLVKPFDVKTFHEVMRRAIAGVSQARTDRKVLDFLGRSPATEEVRRLIFQAAANPSATVLLTGETGVGKDLAARVIHELTLLNKSTAPPLISLNCSTLPSEMFEAELFGAEKGAYTGAHQQRTGLVEAAQDGTLFLDEIADVPFSLQAKLLQFLETRDYRRLGSTQPRHFEGRLIAATNKPLEEEVKQGRFRADLWYRLDVFTIHLPPPSGIAWRTWNASLSSSWVNWPKSLGEPNRT